MAKLFRKNNSVVFIHENIEREWSRFRFLKTAKSVINEFIEDKDLAPLSLSEFKKLNPLYSFLNEYQINKEYYAYLKKDKYGKFYEKYKITAKNFKNVYNSIMREIWVVEPYYSKFCFIGRKPKVELVSMLHNNLSVLQKTKNKNITPIVFYTGLSEEAIEDLFGQDLWKEILKNSEFKNKLLSMRVFQKFYRPKLGEKDYFTEHKKQIIKDSYKKWNVIKPTVLKKLFSIETFEVVYVLGNLFKTKDLCVTYELKMPPTLFDKIKRTVHTAVKKEEKYNIDWDLETWIEFSEKLKVKYPKIFTGVL